MSKWGYARKGFVRRVYYSAEERVQPFATRGGMRLKRRRNDVLARECGTTYIVIMSRNGNHSYLILWNKWGEEGLVGFWWKAGFVAELDNPEQKETNLEKRPTLEHQK